MPFLLPLSFASKNVRPPQKKRLQLVAWLNPPFIQAVILKYLLGTTLKTTTNIYRMLHNLHKIFVYISYIKKCEKPPKILKCFFSLDSHNILWNKHQGLDHVLKIGIKEFERRRVSVCPMLWRASCKSKTQNHIAGGAPGHAKDKVWMSVLSTGLERTVWWFKTKGNNRILSGSLCWSWGKLSPTLDWVDIMKFGKCIT